MVRVWEIKQFADISEALAGNFCTICPRFKADAALVLG